MRIKRENLILKLPQEKNKVGDYLGSLMESHQKVLIIEGAEITQESQEGVEEPYSDTILANFAKSYSQLDYEFLNEVFI